MRFLFFLSFLATSLISFSQAWTNLSPVPVDLAFPVVSVLDSHIYVVGGGNAGTGSALNLRYSVKHNRWDTLAAVPFLSQQPGGGAIAGRIHHFGGGYPRTGNRIATHQSFDPDSNKWRVEVSLPNPTAIHKTAVLGDSIYMLSGQPDKQKVEVYNGLTKQWSRKADLPDGNVWYSAITTHGGKIYRFGGGGSGAPTDAAHVYKPSTDSWSNIAKLPMRLHAPDAAVMGDSIWIGGGYWGGDYFDTVFIYDISQDKYFTGPSFSEATAYHRMVTVGECIYRVGGHNDGVGAGLVMSRRCKGDTATNEKPANPVDTASAVFSEHTQVGETKIRAIYGTHPELLISLGAGFREEIPEIQILDMSGRELERIQNPEVNDREIRMDLSAVLFESGYHIVFLSSKSHQRSFKLWLE